MTFKEYAAIWLERKCPAPGEREPDLRLSTWKVYRGGIRKACSRFGQRPIAEIDSKDIAEFLKWLQDEGKSASTIHNYKAALVGVFEHAADEGLCEVNPCRDGADRFNRVHRQKGRSRRPKERGVFDPDTLTAVLKQCRADLDEQHADLIHIMALTGIRLGEALALRPSSDEGQRLAVRDGYSAGEFYSPKSGKSRVVPIGEGVRAILDRASSRIEADRRLFGFDAAFLFYTYDQNGWPTGKIHGKRKLQREFKAIVEKVCPDSHDWLTLHSLRHTWITELLKAGVDIETVKNMAGHANRSTTEKYTHINEITSDAVRGLAVFDKRLSAVA